MLLACYLPSCFPSVGGIVFSVSGAAVVFLPESVFVAFFSLLGLGFANLALFRRYCTSLSRAAILNSISLESSTGFSVGVSLFCSASVSFFQICGARGKRCFWNASGFQELLYITVSQSHCPWLFCFTQDSSPTCYISTSLSVTQTKDKEKQNPAPAFKNQVQSDHWAPPPPRRQFHMQHKNHYSPQTRWDQAGH